MAIFNSYVSLPEGNMENYFSSNRKIPSQGHQNKRSNTFCFFVSNVSGQGGVFKENGTLSLYHGCNWMSLNTDSLTDDHHRLTHHLVYFQEAWASPGSNQFNSHKIPHRMMNCFWLPQTSSVSPDFSESNWFIPLIFQVSQNSSAMFWI